MNFITTLCFSMLSMLTTIAVSAQRNIVFTDSAVTPETLDTTRSLRHYELTNTSNLFMTVFLARPNAYNLHQLAPALAEDSLFKVGNYQFSFWVDGRLIYQTNLLPGAPRAAQQRKDTVWSKPLIDNTNEGAWWSQSAWNRFLLNGGDSALTDGEHSFRLVIRAYIQATDLKVSDVLAAGELALTVHRVPHVDLSVVPLSPVRAYPGLPVSKAGFDTTIIKELKGNIEASVFRHISSIAVLKDGRLMLEEYFNGSARDSLHDVRSVGKSFASTLTGLAIRDHYLSSENQPLKDFYNLNAFDHYSATKASTTLRELLTMSSRFDGNDDDPSSPGNEENMYPTADWVKFTLDLPMDTIKYTGQWHYFTAGAMLVGSTLDRIIPGRLQRYADRQLFAPLKITRYRWQYTPQGAVNTAGGIQMNTLDFAKYGQLYKNNGRWQGKQILPEGWVQKSFSRYKSITSRPGEYYGYLFWNKTYHVKGKDYETYYCAGNGGNSIFIFRDQPLVIVITATAYGAAYAHPQVDKMMRDYILSAVIRP